MAANALRVGQRTLSLPTSNGLDIRPLRLCFSLLGRYPHCFVHGTRAFATSEACAPVNGEVQHGDEVGEMQVLAKRAQIPRVYG